MISYEHSCIFVHIPRTGGTSIENIIWPSVKDRTEHDLWMGFINSYYNKYQTGGLQHLLATQIRQEIDDTIFDNCLKFTVVRNPWDRIVSQFAFMRIRPDLREFIGMQEDDSFKKYLSLIQKKKHVQWEHQHRFFLDEDGTQLVDHIGRFETFDDDVRQILRKLKLDETRIPHVNSSKREHYQHYYDEESSVIVREMYRKDIELLGYTF